MTPSSNPCTRCGKERVVARIWEEEIETTIGHTSRVKHTAMICPDPSCQQKVEDNLARQQQKREEIRLAKEQRQQSHSRTRNTNRTS